MLLTLDAMELEAMLQNLSAMSYQGVQQLRDIDALIVLACEQGFISEPECRSLQRQSQDVLVSYYGAYDARLTGQGGGRVGEAGGVSQQGSGDGRNRN